MHCSRSGGVLGIASLNPFQCSFPWSSEFSCMHEMISIWLKTQEGHSSSLFVQLSPLSHPTLWTPAGSVSPDSVLSPQPRASARVCLVHSPCGLAYELSQGRRLGHCRAPVICPCLSGSAIFNDPMSISLKPYFHILCPVF